MTVLRFGATATIGALRYRQNLAAVRIVHALAPAVGSARICLPGDVRSEAVPGDEVVIDLDDEAGVAVPVFTGSVGMVRSDISTTTLVCGDATASLAAIRTGTTFERQSAAAIIRSLAREAGVDTAVDIDLDLTCFVAHQNRTVLEHIATLSEWAGCLAVGDEAGVLRVRPYPSPPADRALRYGREIAALSVTSPGRQADIVLAGSGPAGDPTAPDAGKQTVAAVPAGLPGPSARQIRVAAPALRAPKAVKKANQGAAARNGAPRLRATCWLVPQIRAGSTVEIADGTVTGARGPWLVVRAEHAIGPGSRGRTTFEAVSLAAAGGGLLDQLVGAVGSAVGSLI